MNNIEGCDTFAEKKDLKKLSHMPTRYPKNGVFELTIRCNLACKMCLFRHDDSENEEIMKSELSTEQWIDIARQAADAGTLNLLITGGEPLLRPDFCEIWEGIYKLGFIITLYTNAILVNDKVMETLRKYPPHFIGITVYGSNDEIYKNTCGRSNVYDRMVEGVKKLQTLPSIMEFRSTIIKDNYHDVENIERLVKEDFGWEHDLIEARVVTAGVRGACANVSECRLDAKDNIDLLLHRARKQLDEKVKKMGAITTSTAIRVEGKKSKRELQNVNIDGSQKQYTFFGCNAGMTDYSITWNGKMIPCQLLGAYSVEMNDKKLIQAWEELPYVCKPVIYCEECRNCEHFDICEACPATRYAETGDMGGKVPYLCEDVATLLSYTESNV